MIPLEESLCPIEETGIWRRFTDGCYPPRPGLYIVRVKGGKEKKAFCSGGKPNDRYYPDNELVTHWLESEHMIKYKRRRQ